MIFSHKRLSEYSVRQDLPPPDGCMPNKQYGRVLLVDYAGETSEFTAFAQLRCQGALLAQSFPEMAEVLYSIAAVDAAHMEMLERLIAALGVKPRMRTLRKGRARFWSPQFVKCGEDVLQMLSNDILLKQAALNSYADTLRMISDVSIQNIIRCIMADEQLHLDILKDCEQAQRLRQAGG